MPLGGTARARGFHVTLCLMCPPIQLWQDRIDSIVRHLGPMRVLGRTRGGQE
jgi:hypothetical protein